jgi:hypothetical protein
MNVRDALQAGPEHGTDRLPVDIDRRLRRRLGLEADPARSMRAVWQRPAIGAFALAAIIAIVVLVRRTPSSEPAHVAATGFVDVTKGSWSGTVTADAIDVQTDSPTSATVTWNDTTLVVAPGTRVTRTLAGNLALAHGGLQLARKDGTPMFVDVPVGRVVIAAYHSSIKADHQSLTVLIDDGTGHYVDPDGHAHALVPSSPLVWPPPAPPSLTAPSDASAKGSADPTPPRRHDGRTNVGTGSSSAPSPPELPATPAPAAPAASCTFKSDCEPGQTCRKNEAGESVCMGNGGAGAACWFDGDCLSQHCTQRRCTSP